MDQVTTPMDASGPLFYYSCLEDNRGELICVRSETPLDSKDKEYEAKKKIQQFVLPQNIAMSNKNVSLVNPYTAESMFIYMKTNKFPIIVDEALHPASTK